MPGLRSAMLALALLSILVVRPAGAATVAQAPADFGPLTTVATDEQGNGWAVAASKEHFISNFLLRIENGKWRVAADGASRPDLLFQDVGISRMVLSADGSQGWAIGADINLQDPVLWQLKNGDWQPYPLDLPSNARLITDITINRDGSDGWLTVHNPNHAAEYLLRLRNGAWNMVALPENIGIEFVALSPNGQHGWATGYRDGAPRLFYLAGGEWRVYEGGYPAPDMYLDAVAVDDAGNGWVMVEQGQNRDDVVLVNMRQDGFLSSTLEFKPPAGREVSYLRQTISLDASGRGWAAVSFEYGTKGTPDLQYNYGLHLVRLSGSDRAAEVDPASAGADPRVLVTGLSTGYSGGHIWLAGSSEERDGKLIELHEPWPHDKPAAATPLPGAALCFVPVPNCLRGAFAQYWQANGGLTRFGYPITPEVIESHEGKDYVVQYTERARFEYHPENQPPYDVLLGLLGNESVIRRRDEKAFLPAADAGTPGGQYFPLTQHNLAPELLDYWQTTGGLPVYGYPISEPFQEKSPTDGKTYLVQYFERNRLEYHPENQNTPYVVLLGRLGSEQFERVYGFRP